MGKEIVLKSHRYLDKRNTILEKTRYLPSFIAFPALSILTGISAGIIPSILTGHWEFAMIAILTLPATVILSIVGSERYREIMLNRRIKRMCKKFDIALSEKDKEKIKDRLESSNTFSIDLDYRGSKVVVNRADNSKYLKTVKVSKSPESDFRTVFREAVFLTEDTVKTLVQDELLVSRENPTQFDKNIEERVKSIHSALEKSENQIFNFALQPTTQHVKFRAQEANTEFENLKNDYLKDLESRIAEHLNS